MSKMSGRRNLHHDPFDREQLASHFASAWEEPSPAMSPRIKSSGAGPDQAGADQRLVGGSPGRSGETRC